MHAYNLRNIFFAFFVFASAMVFAQQRSSNVQTIDGKKFYIHKIEKSQSLYAISKLYNVSLDDLYSYNPELRAGAKVDQEIKIPVAGSAVANAATSTTAVAIDTNRYLTHRVSRGETLYSLGKKYTLTEKELTAYNPSLTQGVKEGQVLIVGEKNRKRLQIQKPAEVKNPAPPRDKSPHGLLDTGVTKYASKPKKEAYRIALMLPFKLDQTLGLDITELAKNNTGFPQMPDLAVDFYLGFKRAADSLSSAGFDINIDLYDVDERDSTVEANVLKQPEFKQMDMIFGPLFAGTFKTVSKKAKDYSIPVISPFTSQNKILHNNALISKTTPSQYTLMEGLCEYIIDSLYQPGVQVMLAVVNDKDKKEIAFVSAFKRYYNDKQKLAGRRDTVCLVKGMAGVKLQHKPNQQNIVVCLSSNQVSVTDFATQLSIFNNDKSIRLCGWQSAMEMENIDLTYLNHLLYTFPHEYNITNTGAYAALADEYKRLQETSPGATYYIAFDIAYYYLSNLKEKGPDFIYTLDQLPMETNYLRFQFVHPDKQTGFDNRGTYIFKYQDFQIYRTGWR